MKKDIKEFLEEDWNYKLMEKLPCPMVWDFDNVLSGVWFHKIGLGKNKGKYKIEFLNRVGTDLTLKDLGYKSRDIPEQNMTLLATKKQLLDLAKEIFRRFKLAGDKLI